MVFDSLADLIVTAERAAHGCKCDTCRLYRAKYMAKAQEPQQQTIASPALAEIEKLLPLAPDAELDALLRKVESLKLARLLRQRAAMEKRMDEVKRDVTTLDVDLRFVNAAIRTLMERGVQP